MNNLVKNTLIFGAGALVGAIGSYVGLKVVFDRVLEEQKTLAKEEAKQELMEARVKKQDSKNDDEPDEKETNKHIPESTLTAPPEYHEVVNYTHYYKDKETDTMEQEIERIDYEAFCENNGYEKRFITYLENGNIFIDEYDEQMDLSILDLIGEENLGHFGEYEERTLFVRNNRIQVDFELCIEFDY